MRRQQRRREWPLAEVVQACRSAPAVWLALEVMAGEKGTNVVTPTRKKLCKRSGVRDVKTITLALNTLEAARWLDRGHFPSYRESGDRVTLLKIVLRYTTRKTDRIGAPSIRPVKRIKGKTQKTGPNSPTERGGPTRSAPLPPVEAERDPPGIYCEPPPIVAKESADEKTHSRGDDS